ncbi:hypothetical protein PSHT_10616 [Puccinia striiformis]|uniref:C2H2-type domain-containing protein n=1 Tax=Puccinia striiformis TaxID=27350 RepID=A0A2S4V8D9_9BASI|nr:hypothetical protein PSHT_10616 [Puccinia striiformis]
MVPFPFEQNYFGDEPSADQDAPPGYIPQEYSSFPDGMVYAMRPYPADDNSLYIDPSLLHAAPPPPGEVVPLALPSQGLNQQLSAGHSSLGLSNVASSSGGAQSSEAFNFDPFAAPSTLSEAEQYIGYSPQPIPGFFSATPSAVEATPSGLFEEGLYGVAIHPSIPLDAIPAAGFETGHRSHDATQDEAGYSAPSDSNGGWTIDHSHQLDPWNRSQPRSAYPPALVPDDIPVLAPCPPPAGQQGMFYLPLALRAPTSHQTASSSAHPSEKSLSTASRPSVTAALPPSAGHQGDYHAANAQAVSNTGSKRARCDESDSNLPSAKKRGKMPSKEKEYSCEEPGCTQTCKRLWNLRRHYNTHKDPNDPRPTFTCPVCGRHYYNSGDLDHHRRQKDHGGLPPKPRATKPKIVKGWPCEFVDCKKIYKCPRAYEAHLKKVHQLSVAVGVVTREMEENPLAARNPGHSPPTQSAPVAGPSRQPEPQPPVAGPSREPYTHAECDPDDDDYPWEYGL